MAYWRQFWSRFSKDFLAATGEQVIGILLALGVLLFQIKYGIIHTAEVHASYWAVAWPYIFLLGTLSVFHLVRTPYLLHKEAEERHAQEIIAALEQERAAQKETLAAIPTSKNWLDLADRFKSLQYLTADWYTARQVTSWTFHDGAGRSLCSLGGAMLLKSPSLLESTYPSLLSQPNHLERWLNYIKATKDSTHPLRGEETLPDGSKLFSYMGAIEVPKNSADVCVEFAAQSRFGDAA